MLLDVLILQVVGYGGRNQLNGMVKIIIYFIKMKKKRIVYVEEVDKKKAPPPSSGHTSTMYNQAL